MTKQENRTDWESIERDYRAGVLSIREIGRNHGVTDKAIRNKAKAAGWERQDARKELLQLTQEIQDDAYESAGFLYVLMIDSGIERFFKIGMSKQFNSRFSAHQCASPFPVYVACCYFTQNMRAEEKELHAIYHDKRIRGEWFRLSPADLVDISKRSLLINHG